MALNSSEVKTLKIPEDLHTDLKIKAAKDKKQLQELVESILRRGLKEE